jgi:hypothetical protein
LSIRRQSRAADPARADLRIASRGVTQASTRARAALLLTLGLAGASAACGSSSPSPNTPARASFVSRADRVCGEADARIVKLHVPGSGAELPAAARLLGQELTIARTELSSLRGVAAPSAQRAAFARYLGIASQQIETAKRVREFALDGEAAAFHEAAAQLSALSPKSDEAADAAGLAACTRSAEPGGRAG